MGLAAGGLKLCEEIAHNFMEHGLVGTAEKTLMHGSKLLAADDSEEAMLKTLVDKFADYMANSKDLQGIMEKHLSEKSDDKEMLSDLPEDLDDPANSDEASEVMSEDAPEKLKDANEMP